MRLNDLPAFLRRTFRRDTALALIRPVSDVDLPRSLDQPGRHGDKIIARFGPAAFVPADAPTLPCRLVLLAFHNRSGSNLLGSALRHSKAYTGFHEQLNAGTVVRTADSEGLADFAGYLRHISAPARRHDRVFGLKASADQIGMLQHLGALALFPQVDVIHIERDDVLGQAISYVIAKDTMQWSSLQKPATGSAPVYDHARIRAALRDIAWASVRVRLACEAFGLRRLPISYEEVASDSAAAVRRLSAALDVGLGDWRPAEPKFRKQADEVNEAFRERFLAEMAKGGSV